MRNSELLDKIDAAIAGKSLLKHPFYQDWQAGKLSRESLQLYAAQYYRHVEAFPKHLRVLAARLIRLEPAAGRLFYLGTASLSIVGYEHDLSEPVVRLWNDTRHVEG